NPSSRHQCGWASTLYRRYRGVEAVWRTRPPVSLPDITIFKQCDRAGSSVYQKAHQASQGFRSAEGARRTIEGYEAMHAIRKGQIRWVGKGDAVGQRQFIHTIFGIAA